MKDGARKVGWRGGAPRTPSVAVRVGGYVQSRQEMRVRSLGREDPLEEDMATHSSIPA